MQLNSQDIKWYLSQFNLDLSSKIRIYQEKAKFQLAKQAKANAVNAVKKDQLS